MGRYRFANSDVARVDLSDGDWVEFKRELSIGDTLKIQGAAVSHYAMAGDGGAADAPKELRVNLREMKIVRMLTYLAGWSFQTRDQRKTKPIDRTNVEALDPATFAELEAALDAHVLAQEAARTDPPGPSAPAPTAL